MKNLNKLVKTYRVEKENYQSTKNRKLKVKWSIELADDVKAFHTTNLEQELVDSMADSISAKIDSGIISLL